MNMLNMPASLSVPGGVRLPCCLLVLLLMFAARADAGQAENWAPGAVIGEAVPELAARDQFGKSQRLRSLTGEKGLLFLFSRSVNW